MPTQLGLGLGIPLGQGIAWFNSSAYADLAAIADFNNNQYALPALGAELVTNGDFASGSTGWTNSSTGTGSISFTGGQLTVNRVDASNKGVAIQSLSGTSVGSTYEVNATVVSGTAFFGLASGGGNYTAGPVKFYTTAVLSNQSLTIECPNNGSSCVVDNVSVREVILTRDAVALGANLAASGYTMSVNGGTGTATESPTGQLNLTGDGTNPATGDKSFTTVVGGRYRFIYNATQSVRAYIGTSAGGSQITPNTAGAVGFNSLEFTATTTTTWVRFQRTTASLSTITGITVQELPATGAFPKRSATRDEWLAFTAASDTARSYVDQSGTWRTAAYGMTNLVRYSQEFENPAWTKLRSSISPTLFTDPDGTTTARKVVEDTSLNSHAVFQNFTPVAGMYAASVYVKAAERTQVVISGPPSYSDTCFDLITGARISGSTAYTATSAGNGWWRITLVANMTAVSSALYVSSAVGGTNVYQGDGTSGILVWQEQIEPGVTATAPFVTTANAVIGGINTPRFDFRNGKRQLRLEGTTVNTYWPSASGGTPGAGFTRTLNAGLAPNGTMTATRLQWSAIGNSFMLGSSGVTNGAGTTWSGAGWVQPLSGTSSGIMQFQIGKLDSSQTARVRYDSATDTVSLATSGTDVSNGRAYIIERRNGAVRVGITATFAVSYTSNGFTGGYVAGSTSGNFLVWGGQVEEGPFATDLVETFTGAVTRAVETARFSPLLEAIMQRAAASVVVRGRLDAVPVGAAPRVVGGNGGVALINGAGSGTIVGSYNGTASISATVPSSGNIVSPFGSSAAFDSSGRTVGVNGALSGGDTATIGDRAQVLLARAVYIGGSSEYGHGLYDFVGISPERLPSATLQALAVPA